MPRKTSRRFTNYSNENEEQQTSDKQQQYQRQVPDNKAEGTDHLVADMAQGFMQAQAKMADHAAGFNNVEVALLLQKLTDQLDDIKSSVKTKTNSEQEVQQNNKNTEQQEDAPQQKSTPTSMKTNTMENTDTAVPENLKSLLASVLQGKSQNNDNKSETTKEKPTNSSGEGKKQPKTLDMQTVSQVLAQAQYELANELETSLQKLKQVISESEKLATNISNLLGEETKKKS